MTSIEEEEGRRLSVFSIESVEDEVPKSVKTGDNSEIGASSKKKLERRLSISSVFKRCHLSTAEELSYSNIENVVRLSQETATLNFEYSLDSTRSNDINCDLFSISASPAIRKKSKSKRSFNSLNISTTKNNTSSLPNNGLLLQSSESGGSTPDIFFTPPTSSTEVPELRKPSQDKYAAAALNTVSRITPRKSSFAQLDKAYAPLEIFLDTPGKGLKIDQNDQIPNSTKDIKTKVPKPGSIGSQLSRRDQKVETLKLDVNEHTTRTSKDSVAQIPKSSSTNSQISASFRTDLSFVKFGSSVKLDLIDHTLRSTKDNSVQFPKSGSINSQMSTSSRSENLVKSATSNALSIFKMMRHSSNSVKKQSKRDKYDVLFVCHPGSEGEGPWNDSLTISPVISRKLVAGNEKVHVITIGQEFLKDTIKVRRVKIYEHSFVVPDASLIDVVEMMQHNPATAISLANNVLTAPNAGRKLTDKAIEKAAAIKGILGAQSTLQPLFGAWLNPLYVGENGLEASTDVVYLVEHCLNHGTTARCLKPLPKNCSRDEIREKLTTILEEALETCWDSHPSDGYAFVIVTPLGRKGSHSSIVRIPFRGWMPPNKVMSHSRISSWFTDSTHASATKSNSSLDTKDINTKPRKTEKFEPAALDYMPKNESIIKVCSPGMEGDGPWSDKTSTSPFLPRRQSTEQLKIHTMTIGKPFLKDGQAVRRVKIYEHQFSSYNWDPSSINSLLSNSPEQALILSNVFLKNPNAGEKIVDKVMEKEAAIKRLSGAQVTLVPLFGSWLNANEAEDGVMRAASDKIYIVTHDKIQGTIAKAIKSPLGSKKEDIRESLAKDLHQEFVQTWDSHHMTAFSLQIVTPLGKNDFGYYF